MSLSDKCLDCERPHPAGIGGVQRLYRFPSGFGLSAVNSPMLHCYLFAWEIAVLKWEGGDHELTYETELTDDVEVFEDDKKANEFIERAIRAIGTTEQEAAP